jgi:hypothetical protein
VRIIKSNKDYYRFGARRRRRLSVATKIKIIPAKEFLEVTPDGIINITTSRQLLIDIAKAEHHPVDYELLIDFRDTQDQLGIVDVYELAAQLCTHGDTFRRKVALLVPPGVNFDRARFFETCSQNRGFSVNAFTEYEKAMRWLLSDEDMQTDGVPFNKPDTSNDE